jgi:cytochrome o ubiquinol oxidase subunit 2
MGFASNKRNTLVLMPALWLGGCGLLQTGLSQAPVLDPGGPIARSERDLMVTAIALMLTVVIPVFVLTAGFAWRYRASNTRAAYRPEWSRSASIETVVWTVPALIVCCIAYLVWVDTHRLDPYRPIGASAAALEIGVISEDWKWLFIYPAQNIAAVNELVFPADRPVHLTLTSDSAMSAFYIPGLGGQIFAMAGMTTQLNLRADGPGAFTGRNMQYTGDGFPAQTFATRAVTPSEFDAWIATAKQSSDVLDAEHFKALQRPSREARPHYYSSVEPDLFGNVVAKYAQAHDAMQSMADAPTGAR